MITTFSFLQKSLGEFWGLEAGQTSVWERSGVPVGGGRHGGFQGASHTGVRFLQAPVSFPSPAQVSCCCWGGVGPPKVDAGRRAGPVLGAWGSEVALSLCTALTWRAVVLSQGQFCPPGTQATGKGHLGSSESSYPPVSTCANAFVTSLAVGTYRTHKRQTWPTPSVSWCSAPGSPGPCTGAEQRDPQEDPC